MADDPQLLYLEPDDEITGVVRRLRASDASRVVLVAPGRSRATSSAVALRLLSRVTEADGRQLAIVGDALTRSLAAEAGLAAHSSVADARAGLPAASTPAQRAPIHVVAGDEPTVPVSVVPRSDETRLVAVQPREPRPAEAPRRRVRRLVPLVLVGLLALLLAGAGVAAAILLPAATIAITPQAEPIGPLSYEIRVADPPVEAGTLTTTVTGTATATYRDLAAAAGAATFRNYNTVAIEVPAQTRVAAGEVVFATTAGVVVGPGSLTAEGTIAPSEAEAPIVAELAGPSGNVGIGTIATLLDPQRDALLRGFPQNTQPVVINYAPTGGGLDVSGPLIQQSDVDGAIEEARADLDAQLSDAMTTVPGRLYLSGSGVPPDPVIEGADGLVDMRDLAEFQLTATLDYSRPYVERDAVVEEARERLLDDDAAPPAGRELSADSIRVTPGALEADGDALVIKTAVTAMAVPNVDGDALRRQVAGMSVERARSVLDDLGDVEIDLWPGWVDELPRLLWRIEISVGTIEEAPGA